MPVYRTSSWEQLYRPGYLFTAIIVLCLTQPLTLTAQRTVEDRLYQAYSTAADSNRIYLLKQLSDYYYAKKDFAKGDSIIEKMIMRAEATMDRKKVLYAYYQNAGYSSTGTSTLARSGNSLLYTNRALDYAKATGMRDYMAMAYSNLAALYNADGNLVEALRFASLGFTTALGTGNDSAKVVCAIQLGNVYLQQADILTAYKTYTHAYNIAIGSEERFLFPVLHAIAGLYKKLGNKEIARNYIFRSLALNNKNKNAAGQVSDYIFLAKLSNYIAAKDYLQTAIVLADSLQNGFQKNEAHIILFSYMLLQEKPSFVLSYLKSQPELSDIFTNTGPDYINWMKGEVYLYGGFPDSALPYFRAAETSFNKGYDLTSKKNFFGEYAYCYQLLNHLPSAIKYYEKSLELSKTASDLVSLKAHSSALKSLYHQQGNYEKAFHYSLLYDHYKDSVDILSKEKDMALMEIENVAKEQQRAEKEAAEAIRIKYNLQYMFITIIVAAVFVLMLMIGAFKVSTFTIRVMGFFSLIFFFEFIILILDKWIHDITHGEPWKSWLIKIGIISILLPVHHFLEHKLIRYLLSRHLIKVRNNLSMARIFKKKPLPPLKKEEDETSSIVKNV